MSKRAAISFMSLIALGLGAAPARAQFAGPLGAGPYSLTAPEAGAGAIGAGAANSYNPQQTCTQDYRGRSGVVTQCTPDAPAPGKGRR